MKLAPAQFRGAVSFWVAVLPLLTGGCFSLRHHAKLQPIVMAQPPLVLVPPTVTSPVPPPPTSAPPESTTTAKNEGSREDHSDQHHLRHRHPATKIIVDADAQPPHAPGQAPPNKPTGTEAGPPQSLPQLTAGLTPEEAQRYRQSTLGLLTAARADLKVLSGRTLTPDQAATVAQAGEYVRQSQDALDDGDVIRAHNLASKATVLTRALL